ncbi:LPXTG cell wall anchor domain-containing protein [Sphingobium sp. KCTC 72723]|uniref:LPXTG cell wall anchor domain-containing protein n=1 Tax=Sphingobium sp. KCTC 72723 TaxID=2733867 RepID=UPI00165E215E|nr:LPXTG cell wall anchor domain-containing protein [Sphingobium sp. KCTC 72723]
MTGTVQSILMLAGLLLTGGGFYVLVKLRDRKRGALMLVAGLVMFGNVAIMAVPVADLPVPDMAASKQR